MVSSGGEYASGGPYVTPTPSPVDVPESDGTIADSFELNVKTEEYPEENTWKLCSMGECMRVVVLM